MKHTLPLRKCHFGKGLTRSVLGSIKSLDLFRHKSHLFYARDVGYISTEAFDWLGIELDTVLHELNKIISAIRDYSTQKAFP